MAVEVAMRDNGEGVVEQGRPAEDRHIEFALDRAGKRLEAGAFQHQRPHIRVPRRKSALAKTNAIRKVI